MLFKILVTVGKIEIDQIKLSGLIKNLDHFTNTLYAGIIVTVVQPTTLMV